MSNFSSWDILLFLSDEFCWACLEGELRNMYLSRRRLCRCCRILRLLLLLLFNLLGGSTEILLSSLRLWLIFVEYLNFASSLIEDSSISIEPAVVCDDNVGATYSEWLPAADAAAVLVAAVSVLSF